jgi:hypothetical protein
MPAIRSACTKPSIFLVIRYPWDNAEQLACTLLCLGQGLAYCLHSAVPRTSLSFLPALCCAQDKAKHLSCTLQCPDKMLSFLFLPALCSARDKDKHLAFTLLCLG